MGLIMRADSKPEQNLEVWKKRGFEPKIGGVEMM